jgi:hypothetical protein
MARSSDTTRCYGSWQQQHGEPALYCFFGADFSEGTVDNANNRSYINYSGWAEYAGNSALFYGTTRSNVGTLRIYVNGSLVSSTAVPIEYNYTDHHKSLASCSGGCWVTHNDDGKKSISCYAKIDGGSDPRGVGFAWESKTADSVSLTLTDIPRASSLSVSPSIFTATGESSLTVTINGQNGSSMPAKHDLIIRVGGYTQTVEFDGTHSFPITYTWTPSKEVINQIGSSANSVAEVELRTYWEPAKWLTTVNKFGFVVSESAGASIVKQGTKITFQFNGEFFTYDGLFGKRTPLVDKVAVMMYQDKSVPILPYLQIDRVTFSKDTWNQMVRDDTISVDTEEALIKKNSKLNHRLGALGNDYETFALKPGINYIQCLSSNWAETPPDFKLKYREVYL